MFPSLSFTIYKNGHNNNTLSADIFTTIIILLIML